MSKTCEECYSEVDEVMGCECSDDEMFFGDDEDFDMFEEEEPIFETMEPEWDTGPTVDDLIDELIEIGHLR